MIPIVAVIAVGVAVGLFLALRVRRPGARAGGGINQAALNLDLSYSKKAGKDERRTLTLPKGFEKSGEIRHLCRGDLEGRALTIFEHQFFLNTGSAMIPILHTVYAVESPQWPVVSVTPQSWAGRIFGRLRRQRSLQLDREEFNRAFRVTTTDDLFAVTLLSPEMQELMLEKRRGVLWKIADGQVCLIYKGSLKAQRVGASIDRMRRFWSRVPPELEHWSDSIG